MSKRAGQLIRELDLTPHPEGGHFRELFRSPIRVTAAGRERPALTAIHFLLQRGEFSRWHVLASDEVWSFVEGEPLELLCFDPDRRVLRPTRLGPPGEGAATALVPAGHWQAARPRGGHALVTCVVAPGFEFEDLTFVVDLFGQETILPNELREYRDLL